jgi:hypothetical protein
MKQSPLLIFECPDFAIAPGEDHETNPGIFGKSLARWLAEQLHAAGFPAGAVFPEDYGWCIPIGAKPQSLYIVCEGNGDMHWRVFAYTERRLLARLFGQDKDTALLNEVFTAMRHALESAPSIHNLREEAL